MYNVKLKTGLSPSADDHSISEPQKKRGTYAFKLLKNTEPFYRKLYCLYWVRGLWHGCGLSHQEREDPRRSIMFIIELKYEMTAIWKPGDLILWVSGGTIIRSLQPSWHICFDQNPPAVLWVEIAWIHSLAKNRLWPSKQKLTVS